MSHALTPWMIAHLAAAVAAMALGAAVFLRRKGSASHRRLGRAWAVLMLIVIGSSFLIRTNGHFSWLHLLSVGSLVALVLAVYHARNHNLHAHRSTMLGLYVGGLVIAGIFTLLPSRVLGWHLWNALGWLS